MEGNAPFLGSIGGEQLNQPIVAMAKATDGIGNASSAPMAESSHSVTRSSMVRAEGNPLPLPSLVWPVSPPPGSRDPHSISEAVRSGSKFVVGELTRYSWAAIHMPERAVHGRLATGKHTQVDNRRRAGVRWQVRNPSARTLWGTHWTAEPVSPADLSLFGRAI